MSCSRSRSPVSNNSDAVVISQQAESSVPSPSINTSKDALNANEHKTHSLSDALELPAPLFEASMDVTKGVRVDRTINNNGELGWGSGGGKWGDIDGRDDHKTWQLFSPKITSLAHKESSWGHDVSHFAWRLTASSQTDHHVTHFTRGDLIDILPPVDSDKPSIFDDVPNETWARAQLIKSLREAQCSRIPGPHFTLPQVARCLAEVQAELSALNSSVAENEGQITAIQDQQAQLDAQVRELDKQVCTIREKTSATEVVIKRLVEVERDLKDLESIALVYSL
ncbi:hypothetical protein PQX77_021165 [Marasmius sp. AFHP31]|nr:hypothetical protein PQX77_021165 [Marasmius sp. AFHP31]